MSKKKQSFDDKFISMFIPHMAGSFAFMLLFLLGVIGWPPSNLAALLAALFMLLISFFASPVILFRCFQDAAFMPLDSSEAIFLAVGIALYWAVAIAAFKYSKRVL